MGFLQNVKYNYYINNIEGSIKEKNLISLKSLFSKIQKKDPKLFQDLILNNLNQIILIDEFNEFFKKNIIFLNSFNYSDQNILNQFLNFYLIKENIENIQINNYHEECIKALKQNISFEFLWRNSYALQFLISQNRDFSILNNHSSFFVVKDQNKFFTHKFLTQSYIYIIGNPYLIYEEIRNSSGDKNIAMDYLLNLDRQLTKTRSNIDSLEFEHPRNSWDVNLSSWADNQVKYELNGLFLKISDLHENPIDFFSSALLHLKENGLNLNINYQLIDDFIIEKKELLIKPPLPKLSNKEFKQINNILGPTLEKLNLNFEYC